MLGTIYGFIIAVAGLGTIDVTDAANAKVVMAAMASGVSIALYTTFIGQATNILISLQNFNLTQALLHKKEKMLAEFRLKAKHKRADDYENI